MPSPPVAFPWSESELAERIREAVLQYWKARGDQALRQRAARSAADVGTRSEVTGGRHLAALTDLICELVEHSGFRRDEIRFKEGVELPGFYRPMKRWDIVVVRGGRLCAAIEMKSQVGPSFGNNFNNRTEEAVGSSVDFWRAYREGILGTQQPWLGYFLFLEQAPGSVRPVGLAKSVFEPDPIFLDTSYARRYEILCRRMVLDRNYNAASLLLSPRGSLGEYVEPAEDLGSSRFLHALFGHLIGCG